MPGLLEIATQSEAIIAAYIVQPLVILFLGIFIGKLLEQLIMFVAQEIKKDTPSVELSSRITAWVIYIASVAAALQSIKLLEIVLYVLIAAIIIVVAISALLSLIDFFPNAAAHNAVHKKYKAGITIKTNFGEMTVVNVALSDTHCTNKDGEHIYLPNRSVPLKSK